MINRFIWWIQNDANAPAVVVQAFSSLVTAAATGILCYLTYRYIAHTKDISNTSMAQLRALATPMLTIEMEFPGEVFAYGNGRLKDTVKITIGNRGSMPTVISGAIVSWDHKDDGDLVESKIVGIEGSVLAPGQSLTEQFRFNSNHSSPTIEHYESWSDFVSIEVGCADPGGVAMITYRYCNAKGLKTVQRAPNDSI